MNPHAARHLSRLSGRGVAAVQGILHVRPVRAPHVEWEQVSR